MGYRDATNTRFTLSRDATVTLTVRDGGGHMVTRAGSEMAAGTRSWSWSGRDSSGRLADPGTYRVKISARDDVGHRHEVTSKFKVDKYPSTQTSSGDRVR
jgi:flagellar hook assembly protein FlgD